MLYFEISDDVVLFAFIIERFKKEFFRVASLQGTRQFSQDVKHCIGEILIKIWGIAGIVEDIVQRMKPSFFNVELVFVAVMDEGFEITKSNS